MPSTVILWLFLVTYIVLHEVFPPFKIFCNCVLFRFIGISECTEIAILMSKSAMTNFFSGQSIRSLSPRSFSELTNENKIRCQVISRPKLHSGRCLT